MVRTCISIEGMRCPMCEAHIQDAIRKIGGIKKVKAYRKKNEVVIISNDNISEEMLHSVIDPTGYRLNGIKSETYEDKKEGSAIGKFFGKIFSRC